jgi:SAM-dependent methyltransferase
MENCRLDGATGVCHLVDYDQAERLDETTRRLGAKEFFEYCDQLIVKKFGRWGFKHFLQYFPNIDPQTDLARLFENGAFNLASTHLFTNQITTAAKAGIYHTIDEKEFFIRGERSLDSRRERLDQLTFSAEERVLDIGCSSGIISTYLARRGCRVTGVDLDAEIILGCKILANILGTGNSYLYHDLDQGPVPGDFDTVILFSVIHHTKNLKQNAQAIAAQCRRIIIECRLVEGGLKPTTDGRWQHTSNWRFQTTEEMVSFLEQLFPGFKLARNLGQGDRDRYMLELVKTG